jgi:hypothetical protein
MSKLVSLNINLDKIDKTKIFAGKKGKYYSLTLSISDEEDQFGNTVSAWTSQDENERKAKAERNYIGNGKTLWSDAGEVKVAATVEEEDDLPF